MRACGGATSTRPGSLESPQRQRHPPVHSRTGATSIRSSRTITLAEHPSATARPVRESAGSTRPCLSCDTPPTLRNSIQPDRGKADEPARQKRSNGTGRSRTAGTPFCRNGTTQRRQNRLWCRTRSVPTERTKGRRPATSSDRANPAGPYLRTAPPGKASSPSSYSSPAWPRNNMTRPRQDKTRTPFAINENTSFRRNDSSAAQSIRSPVVPAERHRSVQEARTPRTAVPGQPTAITSNRHVSSKRSTVRSTRTPVGRSVRSSTTSPGGLRFA